MLIALVGQRAEHRAGDAGVAAHADADHADLGDVRVGRAARSSRSLAAVAGSAAAARGRSVLADGEGHVGGAVGGDVLHDHVHVDVRRRPAGRRSAAAMPGRSGTRAHRDLRLVARIGDAGRPFPFPRFRPRPPPVCRAGRCRAVVVEARQHLHAHPLLHRQLDAAGLQHLGADRGELQHFLVGDLIQLAGAAQRCAGRWCRRRRRRYRCRSGRPAARRPAPPPRCPSRRGPAW